MLIGYITHKIFPEMRACLQYKEKLIKKAWSTHCNYSALSVVLSYNGMNYSILFGLNHRAISCQWAEGVCLPLCDISALIEDNEIPLTCE